MCRLGFLKRRATRQRTEETRNLQESQAGGRVMSSQAPLLGYISATDLINKRNPSLVVVDVRDDERQYDGHIAGSLHYPSSTFDEQIPELLKDLKNSKTVVFHCALSQVRGPTCARALLNEFSNARGGATSGKRPEVLVLERGFNGWSGAGWPVCYCKESSCTHKP